MIKQPKDAVFKVVNGGAGAEFKLVWNKDFATRMNQKAHVAQFVFDSEFLRHSLKRLPHQSGNFQARTIIANGRLAGTGAVLYPGPFARMLNAGKLMIGVLSKSAYANFGEPKVATDKDLAFTGAPQRGAKWAERTWNEDKDKILKSVRAAYEKGKIE